MPSKSDDVTEQDQHNRLHRLQQATLNFRNIQIDTLRHMNSAAWLSYREIWLANQSISLQSLYVGERTWPDSDC